MLKTKLLLLCLLIISLLTVNSCSRKESEKITLRLGYAPIADAAQIYVAMDKGYFAEQGIEIKLEQLGSGAKILEAVGVGSIEIGLSSYVPLVLANAGGIQLAAITGGPVEDKEHPEHAILIKKNSTIKGVSDLAGKTIALNGRRNIDHMILQELLEKHGLTEEQVKITEIPFPRMETVVDSGEVDAACAIEPFVTRAVQHGNLRVLTHNFLAMYDRIPIACYVARKEWIDENPQIVVRFRTAFNKATEFCLTKPDETKTIIAKYTKLTEDELRTVGLPTFAAKTDLNELQSLIDRMLQRGLIQEKINAKELVYGQH
jgi:NitT/TauT family transport system substrate-binding protein